MSQLSANPFIEVILSRPSYRVGESLVGTVRLVPTTNLDPRNTFSDSYIFVAGWCRLDPRWHRAAEYAKVFESPAVHYNLQNRRSNSSVIIDDHCVCFWTTNVVNLMELQERTNGRWQDVKPKQIGKTNDKKKSKKQWHNEASQKSATKQGKFNGPTVDSGCDVTTFKCFISGCVVWYSRRYSYARHALAQWWWQKIQIPDLARMTRKDPDI